MTKRHDGRPERRDTDDTLENERERTDRELLVRSQSISEDADAVIQRARERAEAVLALARTRADAIAGEDDDRGVTHARATEDTARDAEYAVADHALNLEREQRRLALRQLLALEREATDRMLALEREISDRHAIAHDAVSAVAHDLRGLLQTVSISAATIVVGVDRELPVTKVIELANHIQHATAQMELVLGDLQELAAIENGRARNALRATNLADLVRTAVEIHQPAANVNELALDLDLPAQPVVLRVDPHRMARVLLNVIANAIKFTPTGGSIRVGLRRIEGGVEIEVRDTGPGIATDQLDAIFERFGQGSAEPVRGHGIGLGLYIARSIVSAHGGRIWAENAPGGGAVFRVRLPA